MNMEVTKEWIKAELQVGLVDVKVGSWIQAVYNSQMNCVWTERVTKVTPKFIHTELVIVTDKYIYRPHYEEFKAEGRVFEETEHHFIYIMSPSKHKKEDILYSKLLPTPMFTIPAEYLAVLRGWLATEQEHTYRWKVEYHAKKAIANDDVVANAIANGELLLS